MRTIVNPVLSGFHPDPSLCRVGDDFYLATSTFEWFPGVEIHHSRDLVNWNPVARPLDTPDLLDLRGVQSSGGVWAPCLSWADGLFWLVFTNVTTWRGEPQADWGQFKDTPNFVVTAPTIQGPWSSPSFLNASGFDPSLFHDTDGRKWLVNMQWDYRLGRHQFPGILLQEFDPQTRTLVGPSKLIFRGTDIRFTEGPHLYRRGEFYYLLCAEGGTGYGHAVTLVRSRSLEGPWEIHPWHPLLHSLPDRTLLQTLSGVDFLADNAPPLPDGFYTTIQKAGHASMVEWKGNEWVLAHLCGRPLPGTVHCPLGRETALQKIVWKEDGWPYPDSQIARNSVSFTGTSVQKTTRRSFFDDFEGPRWNPAFMSLRTPLGPDGDLAARPGWLRLRGRSSPVSAFDQRILACRVRTFRWEAQTRLDFHPTSFQHLAGLMVRYDERNQTYARITWDEERQTRTLGLLAFEAGRFSMPMGDKEIDVGHSGIVQLRVTMDHRDLKYSWSSANGDWEELGPVFDTARLSDEHSWPMAFTGLFVGMAAHDLTGGGLAADFDRFSYYELGEGAE